MGLVTQLLASGCDAPCGPFVGECDAPCDRSARGACWDGVWCSPEPDPSVVLEVVDAETGELIEAEVTFTVDEDEDLREAALTESGHVLALREPGWFRVTIAAEGHHAEVREYEVIEDECGVVTVEDVIELRPWDLGRPEVVGEYGEEPRED